MEKHWWNITALIIFPLRFWEPTCCPAGFPFIAAKVRWGRIKFGALLVFADWIISLILFSSTFSDFGNRKHILFDFTSVRATFQQRKRRRERKYFFPPISLSVLDWHYDTVTLFWVSELITLHFLINVQPGSTKININTLKSKVRYNKYERRTNSLSWYLSFLQIHFTWWEKLYFSTPLSKL